MVINFRCCATTLKGTRCKNKQDFNIFNGYCNTHKLIPLTNYNKSDRDICSICHIDKIEDPVKLDNCNHYYCVECINIWLYDNNNCPICRTVVSPIETRRSTVYGILNNQILHIQKHTYSTTGIDDFELSFFINTVNSIIVKDFSEYRDEYVLSPGKVYFKYNWETIVRAICTSTQLIDIFYKFELKKENLVKKYNYTNDMDNILLTSPIFYYFQ